MISLDALTSMDQEDPLADKRAEFYLPENTVYLDGNSLGPMPLAAKQRALDVIQNQWGEDLIKSWNLHDWIGLPQRVGEKIGRLIGAAPGQVICTDSISVNLFKLLSVALSKNQPRTKIVSQQDNFPTDLYMVQGLQQLIGEDRCELVMAAEDEIEHLLDEDVAILMLTQVNFRTGRKLDMSRLTQIAQSKGILVIWDLAHSAGAFNLELDACKVDFAVGCGYKYLNGGPGSPAFVYVAHRHQKGLSQPLTGWMGHAHPFTFDADYTGPESVTQMLCGTPPIVSMSVLDAALDVFDDVNMTDVRAKSVGLCETFISLVEQQPLLAELELISPRDSAQRGSQLAYAHSDAYAICQALIERNIIADFRAPNVLRLGFTPLYLGYADIYHCVQELTDIMASKTYLEARFQVKQKVT